MRLSSKTAVHTAALIALASTVAACGNSEEAQNSETMTSTATSSSKASSSEAASSSELPASESSAEDEPAAENQDAPAGGDPLNPQAADGQDPPLPFPEPLQGGSPASDADREQMEKTMHATVNPPSAEKWTRVLMENSCRKVVEPFEAEMARSGITLDQVEQAARMQAEAGQSIELPQTEVSLTDVRVENSRASATATLKNQNGSESQTQIFEREDGQWKLCN